MYAENRNSQAVLSKRLICEGLRTLLETESFEDITVTQVCQEARVARKTFYRHFDRKADALEYELDAMFRGFLENRELRGESLETLLSETFDYARDHGDFLRLLRDKDLFHLVQSSYARTLPGTLAAHAGTRGTQSDDLGATEPYIVNFIASAFCSVLSLWVEHDFRETTGWLAGITAMFLRGLGRHLGGEGGPNAE